MFITRTLRRRFEVVAALLVLSLAASAQIMVDWQTQSPANSPGPSDAPAMAYDAAHQQIVLFGGYDGSSYLGDTWTYDGNTWTLRAPMNSPPPRAAGRLAYDAPTQRVILFGGFNGAYLGDTWTWDGTNWTQSTAGAAPTPVTGPMLFTDPITQSVLLYGGYDGHFYHLDMFRWTVGGWSQLNPSTVPYARSTAVVVSDPPHNQVVLFGGLGSVNPNNTWTWNGTTWTEVFPNTQPPLVYDSAGAFDPAIGHPILFGGGSGGQDIQDTWEWTGTDWVQLFPQNMPSPREAFGLAYDAALGHIVLFGGSDNGAPIFNDTWSLTVPVGCCQPYCLGDGSGTACPCGNSSPGGVPAGCLNSFGTGGKLLVSGQASLSSDSLVLSGSDMPSSTALYFQGTTRTNGGAGSVFGDGLRCASGVIVRLGSKTNSAGASQYPTAGDAPVSVRGQIAAPGIRDYQVWYRNAAPFCTPSTFNLSNGYEVTWTP